MFSGIVAAVGRITHLSARSDEKNTVRLTIEAGALGLDDVALGDSIACNGVCLTVVERAAEHYSVDVSQETFNCTIGFTPGEAVNLEKALRLSDPLGGHLVSGHVDGVGEVTYFAPVAADDKDASWHLEIRAPGNLGRYMAVKGSVAVNGVSLTVNTVHGDIFSINLIPHTLENTMLRHLKAGSKVNLEADMLARYAERLLAYTNESDKD